MTSNQKSSERHQTSVFSDYENNSNNSISSKQLELWLQQMAPTSHTSPKFGQDWNLMSTSSRFESDGMTFGARMDTFQSANKQNILSKANFVIEPSKSMLKENHYQSLSHAENFQKIKSSKSYINAMQELQKRAKTLEEDNVNMRKSLQIFQQQKRNSLQSSMIESEELKEKMMKYEDTGKRMEEMRRENKKLRDSKNQQCLKIKLMQKSINEQKSKVKTFEQRLEMLSKENQDLKQQLVNSTNMTKSLMMENKQLAHKTETLQNMKEKSTNSILEKYAKALERIQQLELTIGELKNKGQSMEDKNKKVIEEKDAKYWSSLETINNLKLEKENLAMRLQNSHNEVDEKVKKISKLQEKSRLLEEECSEQNKTILTLKHMNAQKDTKFNDLNSKYTKVQKKYTEVKDKIKIQRKIHLEEIKVLKQKISTTQHQECKSEHEESNEYQSLEQNSEHYDTNMSHYVEAKPQEEDTPVERYDQTSPDYENAELEEFTALAKPLSIIINAKNSQPRIKSEEAETFKVNPKLNQSSEEQDSSDDQKHAATKIQSNSIPKQKITQQKKPSSKTTKQQKSQSKQSFKSTNSRKQSLQDSKYLIPTSNFKKNKPQTKIIANNSALSSHNRSKSSSIQKKKISQQKSISMDSKRPSRSQTKSKQNSDKRANPMIKSSQPSQSRYLNQKSPETHLYMSAQPTRYPSHHPQHYYYTNEINAKRNYEDPTVTHQESYHPNTSLHTKSMIGKSESQVKKALNKALLLQYQEEALKLYEEHEQLLEMSENQDASSQQKAQTLGRIRQVMNMIDHNTEKIFNIKARVE